MPFNHYVLVNLEIILHKNTKCCLKLFLSAKVNLQKVFLYSLYFGKFEMILHKNTKGCLKLSLSVKLNLQRVFEEDVYKKYNPDSKKRNSRKR